VIDRGCEVRDFSLDEVLETPVKVDELQEATIRDRELRSTLRSCARGEKTDAFDDLSSRSSIVKRRRMLQLVRLRFLMIDPKLRVIKRHQIGDAAALDNIV